MRELPEEKNREEQPYGKKSSFPLAATYPISTGIAPENAPTKVQIGVCRLSGV